MSDTIPFYQNTFIITEKDKDGKKFDNGVLFRLTAFQCPASLVSTTHRTWNSFLMSTRMSTTSSMCTAPPLFIFVSGVRFSLALVRKLYETEPDHYVPLSSHGATIADKYDYVMHGKIFKFVDDPSGKLYRLIIPSRPSFPLLQVMFNLIRRPPHDDAGCSPRA